MHYGKNPHNKPILSFFLLSFFCHHVLVRTSKLSLVLRPLTNFVNTGTQFAKALWLLWMIESSWEFGMLWIDSFLGFFALTRLQGILTLKVLYYDSKAQKRQSRRRPAKQRIFKTIADIWRAVSSTSSRYCISKLDVPVVSSPATLSDHDRIS
jgi:hypothetical protein